MRCGCPNCGAYMVHRERKNACVCTQCGHECRICLGADNRKADAIKRENGRIKVPEEILKRYDG